MHMIVTHDQPRDWIVATGQSHSVRELCNYVFRALDMNYQDHVVQNQKFIRPEELKFLKGDSTDIRTVLGWQPVYTFESMLDEMIEYWLQQDHV
jgi:GDPmannose 4,6-dehydratase